MYVPYIVNMYMYLTRSHVIDSGLVDKNYVNVIITLRKMAVGILRNKDLRSSILAFLDFFRGRERGTPSCLGPFALIVLPMRESLRQENELCLHRLAPTQTRKWKSYIHV